MNVSQVCREAIQHHVRVSQRARKKAQSGSIMEQIARLDELLPKPIVEPDWETLAIKDAEEWVKRVNPEAWNTFVNQSDFFRREGRDESVMIDSWSSSADVKGPDIRLWENRDWLIEQYDLEILTGTDSNHREQARKEYARAWLAFVYEVRHLLEKHRKEELHRIMNERAKSLEARPIPELPEHLI